MFTYRFSITWLVVCKTRKTWSKNGKSKGLLRDLYYTFGDSENLKSPTQTIIVPCYVLAMWSSASPFMLPYYGAESSHHRSDQSILGGAGSFMDHSIPNVALGRGWHYLHFANEKTERLDDIGSQEQCWKLIMAALISKFRLSRDVLSVCSS